jgi:hypothetical protein
MLLFPEEFFSRPSVASLILVYFSFGSSRQRSFVCWYVRTCSGRMIAVFRSLLSAVGIFGRKEKINRKKPWSSIRLWDVESPTISGQSAHRWRWGCQAGNDKESCGDLTSRPRTGLCSGYLSGAYV